MPLLVLTPGRILCLLFGGTAFMAGVTMMGNNLYIVQAGLRTPGVIVANEWGSTAHNHTYYPVVRFVARGGQTYVVRGADGGLGADPPEFRVGEKVTVSYDPQDPRRALIDSDHLWLLPVATLVGGTFFGLAGAWDVLRAGRCTQHKSTTRSRRQSTIRPRQSSPARRRSSGPARRHR